MLTYPIGLLATKAGGFPTDGLVAYYPFNGNANDSSGYGNNGTVAGATLTTDRNGIPNKAYSFDGINDIITITNQSQLLSDIYSISLWIYLLAAPATNGHVYGCWTTASTVNRNFSIRINSSRLIQFLNNDSLNNASVYDSSVAIPLTTWTHIVCIHDSSDDKIYIDSVLDLSASYSVGSFNSGNKKNSSTPYTIGDYDSNDRPINSGIDDIFQYHRALTSDEILVLYNL